MEKPGNAVVRNNATKFGLLRAYIGIILSNFRVTPVSYQVAASSFKAPPVFME
jgi:hypothetical protein